MKILLIAPVKDLNSEKNTVKSIRFPMISLLYIAAVTPEIHDVRIIEEEDEKIDFSSDCDLVGITSMTGTAIRAYQIADEFRKKGKKVVLGGIHPTVLPEEAKIHCDSVMIGEAEPVWNEMLQDCEMDRMKPYYNGGIAKCLDDYPLPRRELLRGKTALGLQPIVTSRGCPYSCDFCSVWKFFGKKIRHVSVENVVRDIQNANTSRFMFLDDNIVGDQIYAKELFSVLKELNIQWVGQASVSFIKNAELLKLASESGCRGLFFGLETVSEKKMKRYSKSMKSQADILDAISKVMSYGIVFHASLVFGFDDDDKSVFDETLEFLYKSKIPSATFNILTPYPGTDVYQRLKEQNRLITEDWQFYDHCTPTYIPRNMSLGDLYNGYQYVKENFFSLKSTIHRFPANWRNPIIFTLANIGMKKEFVSEKDFVKRRLEKLYEIMEQKILCMPS